jgi:DNA-binding transcriptional LysR family regulator
MYDQVVQAAVGGQGVALGRLPMIAEHLRDGRLVAPFPKKYDTARSYFALVAPGAEERDDVEAFMRWLAEEAALETPKRLSSPVARSR